MVFFTKNILKNGQLISGKPKTDPVHIEEVTPPLYTNVFIPRTFLRGHFYYILIKKNIRKTRVPSAGKTDGMYFPYLSNANITLSLTQNLSCPNVGARMKIYIK